MNKIYSIFTWITLHPRQVLAACLLLTIPLGWFFIHQEHQNHVDIYFEKDNPNLVFYKNFQKQYGNEELAAIVFTRDTVFTLESINYIRELSEQLKRLDGVQRVFSLAESEEAVGKEDTVIFRPVIPEGPLTPGTVTKAKKRALSHPTIVNHLVSEDGSTAAILIEIEPLKNMAKYNTLQQIKKTAHDLAQPGYTLHFAGVPFIEAEMNVLSKRDFMIFTPVVFILIFIFVSLLLRNITLAVLCQVNLLVALVWAIGFFVMTGETLNMVTVVMGAVLLAIAVADSIHLLSRLSDQMRQPGMLFRDAVWSSMKHVWIPCLFTTLTTSVSFLSFLSGTVRPAKTLGIYTSIGIFFALILTMTLLPSMVLLFKKRVQPESPPRQDIRKTNGLLEYILTGSGKISTRHFILVPSVLLLIVVLSLFGMKQIKFETNTMNYLPESNNLRDDIRIIEDNLGGVIPFVFIIESNKAGNDFTHPESLKMIDQLQQHLLEHIQQFSTSFSIADYMKEINRAFNAGDESYYRIPQHRIDIYDYLEIGDPEILDRIISPDYMETRLSFQSRWDSNETANELSDYIHSYLEDTLGDEYTFKITGLSSLYLHMEENLRVSQKRSFLIAFGIIFFMMLGITRNLKMALICMVPNLFPIVVTLGIMGWQNIPLDVSTIMIANVTIGIAIDDTIHFIVWFRRNMEKGMCHADAILQTLKDVGKPVMITTVVLFMGFFVLVMGAINPTRAFGVLTALSMLFALMGDLFILPSLIMIFKPSFGINKK